MQVLFLVFNRPDLTRKVFECISEARPDKLYIAADGPRRNVPDDIEKCERVREIVSRVDWDCEVHRLFHDDNLGMSEAERRAISWFFEHEPEGIILEDDCLPDRTFFHYCEELLLKYRYNEKILMVAGSNFIPDYKFGSSYTFSRLALIWGWATWRRAWQLYDAEMKEWPEYAKTDGFDYFGRQRDVMFNIFNKEYLNESLENWNVPWRFCCIVHRVFCIVPQNNLVRNLGIGRSDATRHVRYHKLAEVPVLPIEFPLIPPKAILPNRTFDQETLEFLFGGSDPVPY